MLKYFKSVICLAVLSGILLVVSFIPESYDTQSDLVMASLIIALLGCVISLIKLHRLK